MEGPDGTTSSGSVHTQLRQLQESVALIASQVGVPTSSTSSAPSSSSATVATSGLFSPGLSSRHHLDSYTAVAQGLNNNNSSGGMHSENPTLVALQSAVRQLDLRVSSLESHFGTLEGDLIAFKRDTRQALEAMMARIHQGTSSGHNSNTPESTQQTSLLPGHFGNFPQLPRYQPIFSNSLPSPLPMSPSLITTGSSPSIPTFSAASSSSASAHALPGNAVVSLDGVGRGSANTNSPHGLSSMAGGEPEYKKRKRKTDEENKLRELIRLEMSSLIDWDVDRSGPGTKPLRKAPQPDKSPQDGLWVPDFTQTIKQSPHNARFVDTIMARLQSEETLRRHPSLRPLLMNASELRNIVETRFSTIKGDYAAQNNDVKMKAREEKTYKGKQARRGDRKAARRMQQLLKHEAELVAEGYPPEMRHGFDAAALHSDEESEEEMAANGSVTKFCRPVAIPFRSKLMNQLINRVDELIESDRATGDRTTPRYSRRERRPFAGDFAAAPRPPRNKLYRWQVDGEYLKALYEQGATDHDLGLLPDVPRPQQHHQQQHNSTSQTHHQHQEHGQRQRQAEANAHHFDLSHHHHHQQSDQDDYDLSALNQIDPELTS